MVKCMSTEPKVFLHQHPKEIYSLFFTELWERFSYYGLTALLILYLYKHMGITEQEAYLIYGTYGALVYITSVLGGWLADRFLGRFFATLWGSIFIAVGHFVMFIPDPQHDFFYIGLGIIIVGTGLFKPNIANLIGKLYGTKPHLRNSGFTLAHVGCNIGTILAPIICAYIAVHVSYPAAFGIAGFGMLLGIKSLVKIKGRVDIEVTPRKYNFMVIILGLMLVALIYQIFQHITVTGYILAIVGILTVVMLGKTVLISAKRQRSKILYAIGLMGLYLIFMILLQISGGALNVFTDRYVDRVWLQYTIPTGAFQAVEPIAVVLLGLISMRLWQYSSKASNAISYVVFFALALFLQGLSFIILCVGIDIYAGQALVPMIWLNTAYVLQAIGELFIAPIGLSMLSHWIPNKSLGVFMGAWLLMSAYANFIAAQLGVIFVSPTEAPVTISAYANLFQGLALLGSGCGTIILLGIVTIYLKDKLCS